MSASQPAGSGARDLPFRGTIAHLRVAHVPCRSCSLGFTAAGSQSNHRSATGLSPQFAPGPKPSSSSSGPVAPTSSTARPSGVSNCATWRLRPSPSCAWSMEISCQPRSASRRGQLAHPRRAPTDNASTSMHRTLAGFASTRSPRRRNGSRRSARTTTESWPCRQLSPSGQRASVPSRARSAASPGCARPRRDPRRAARRGAASRSDRAAAPASGAARCGAPARRPR